MDPTDSPRFVVATRVKAGRDSDFEQFMREVVVPAEAGRGRTRSACGTSYVPLRISPRERAVPGS